MAKRLMLSLRYTDPILPQFFNAFVAFLWGLWLLMPWDTFSRSVTYRLLRDTAPETVWGGAFVLIGTLHMAFALWDCQNCWSWRRIFSFIGWLKWTFVAVLFTIGGYQATATVIYGSIALVSLWVFIRIGLMEETNAK